MPDALILALLFFVVFPLWLAAGFADYLCHRAEGIEHNAGQKESLLHLFMSAEIGAPFLAILFLDVNALILALMFVCLALHEATTLWDLAYASRMRRIGWIEQHVHSYLSLMPLVAFLLLAVLHWDQTLALFGAGDVPARFELRFKFEPLPVWLVVTALAATTLFGFLPLLEELWRGWKAARSRA